MHSLSLLAVLTHWGPVQASEAHAVRADFMPGASNGMLDGDGMVDSSELIGVIQAWGSCPDDAIEDMLCFPVDSDGDGVSKPMIETGISKLQGLKTKLSEDRRQSCSFEHVHFEGFIFK